MVNKIIILSLLAALLLLVVGCAQEQLTPEEKEIFGEGGAVAGQAVSYDRTRYDGCRKDKKCASNFIVCYRAECSKTKDSSACINKCLEKVLGGKAKPLTFINIRDLTGSENEEEISIAWGELKALEFNPNNPLVIAGPMRLAALTFQKELEKNLGPSFVSEVRGLPSISYTGDITSNKLFFEYVETLMDFKSLTPSSPMETWGVLEKITTQIVSLSANQLIDLDFAIYDAFQVSSARLKEIGIDENEFLRVMTPAFLLVYDATKHYGLNSQIYRLYKENGAGLMTLVGQKGLSMNYLPAYDRISGALVGMPICEKGKMAEDGCVDPKTLMESLQEPRALGLGDCALGSMLAKGTEKLEIADFDDSGKVVSREEKELYTCPTDKCGDPEQSEDNQREAVNLFGGSDPGWADSPESEGEEVFGEEEVLGFMCQGGSSNQGGFSGAFSDRGCLNSNIFESESLIGGDILSCASDPWSRATVGGSRDMMFGVPMSRDCMLMDDVGPWTRDTVQERGVARTWAQIRLYHINDKSYTVMETKSYGRDDKYQGGSIITVSEGETKSKIVFNKNGECIKDCGRHPPTQLGLIEPTEEKTEPTEPEEPAEGAEPEESEEGAEPAGGAKAAAKAQQQGMCSPEAGDCGSSCGGLPSQTAATRDCFKDNVVQHIEDTKRGGGKKRKVGIPVDAPIDPLRDGYNLRMVMIIALKHVHLEVKWVDLEETKALAMQ